MEFVTRALLLRNGVSVVASAEATEEFLEDSEDIVETGLISAAEPVDEVTGDVEDIPAGEEEPRTELDHVLFRSMGCRWHATHWRERYSYWRVGGKTSFPAMNRRCFA